MRVIGCKFYVKKKLDPRPPTEHAEQSIIILKYYNYSHVNRDSQKKITLLINSRFLPHDLLDVPK